MLRWPRALFMWCQVPSARHCCCGNYTASSGNSSLCGARQLFLEVWHGAGPYRQHLALLQCIKCLAGIELLEREKPVWLIRMGSKVGQDLRLPRAHYTSKKI